MSILVFAEHEGGAFKKSALELLGKASELASELGTDVTAAVLGDAPAATLGAYGAARVYHVGGDFSSYSTTQTAGALADAIRAADPSAVLASASFAGKDALPRVVAKFDSGLGSECTDLRVDGGAVVGRRPLYAGKVYADVKISGSPAFFSMRANSFPQPASTGGSAEVISVSSEASALLEVVERKAPESLDVDLTEAERIVSGGRSLKSKEGFDDVIRPLAKSISATVGASRAAVDAGYAPHAEQVGQTGKTVNPTLYIANGISGAIQHLAGMRTSKVIVAINKDPEAPIFEHSTYGIVADLFEVCPKLQAEFDKILAD